MFFYILLIVLVILLIVLVAAAIKTVNKANEILDDVKRKSEKLDGVFDIVESTSGIVNNITDRITLSIANFITRLFDRKGDDKNE